MAEKGMVGRISFFALIDFYLYLFTTHFSKVRKIFFFIEMVGKISFLPQSTFSLFSYFHFSEVGFLR